MTGFSAADRIVAGLSVSWELRTVNHRFLDINFRLPEEYRSMEPACRSQVSAALGRGKVDCTLRVQHRAPGQDSLALNTDALAAAVRLFQLAKDQAPEAGPPSLSDLLRWPGVVEERRPETQAVSEAALDGLEEGLQTLVAARSREGDYLASLISERCARIRAIAQELRPRAGSVEERFRQRLGERLDKLDLQINPERLEQELALMLQRLDIAEELDRLEGHLREVEQALTSAEPVGRRLDFLVQELNRESNTIASKSNDVLQSSLTVELKVLVEQIREQVQNVE